MNRLRGAALVLTGAVFWGGSATVAKLLLNRDVPTLLIVQTRVTFAFLALLLGNALLRREHFAISWADLRTLAFVGVLGVAGSNFTYYFTIGETSVATAILLQYLAPILVMTYGVLRRTERLSRELVVAAVLSVVGCSLAVGAWESGALKASPLGIAVGLLSAVVFAYLTIGSASVLRRVSSATVTLYSIGWASLFWVFLNPPWEMARAITEGGLWWELLVFAVISILIPHSLYFAGLRTVSPSQAIILTTLEPVVAIGSAAVALGELLTPVQIVGSVCVVAGVVAAQLRRADQPVRKNAAD